MIEFLSENPFAVIVLLASAMALAYGVFLYTCKPPLTEDWGVPVYAPVDGACYGDRLSELKLVRITTQDGAVTTLDAQRPTWQLDEFGLTACAGLTVEQHRKITQAMFQYHPADFVKSDMVFSAMKDKNTPVKLTFVGTFINIVSYVSTVPDVKGTESFNLHFAFDVLQEEPQ